jgi:hypothetical protein
MNRITIWILLFAWMSRGTADDKPLPSASVELAAKIASVPIAHPRLIANNAQFERLRQSLGDSDSTRDVLAKHVIRQADLICELSPIKRELQGRRLLGQSRRCLDRMLNLSMAFQLTGETKYLDRGRREMLAVAEFSDWNPSHFLDVAEMTLAMAIGYDWMFDGLDPPSRQTIRSAIKRMGVELPFTSKHNRWVRATNNWGQVCHCGLTAGAFAILEDEPALAAKTVQNAIENLPRSMKAFAPRGSYPEGPGYWAYGTSFNVIVIAMLEGVLGSDFGLCDEQGFDETGQYLCLMTGPSGQAFNYADGGASRRPEPALYWFAKRYRRSDWLLGERRRVRSAIEDFESADAGSGTNRLLPLALLWMTGDEEELNEGDIKMPLNWQSESTTPVAVHRSSWTAPDTTFIGLKAGSPSAPHGQMDTGSFVMDADGVRWALDLGAEGYHGIESRGMNLWSSAQDSDRWTIFRQSNSGHNTLVIDGKLQVAEGHSKLVDFSDQPSFPHSVADLSPVYRGQAGSVRRGVALLPSREALIQDELSGIEPGRRVRWAMLTEAEIAGQDGPRLVLTQQDKRLELTITQPPGAKWEFMNMEEPQNEWDSPNPGTRMVLFQAVAPSSGDLRLVVVATPGSCDAPRGERSEVVPLDDW